MDATKYNITVRKGVFEGKELFEARVLELPDVAEYADSYAGAYALAIDTLETTAEIFAEKGKMMPQPIVPVDDFSGRVTLRMPKSMHCAYSSWADIEGVSLNHLLVNCLSFTLGNLQSPPTARTETTDRIPLLSTRAKRAGQR